MRRTFMLSLAAIAAVTILPATAFAKASDAKQDAALVKAVGQKISGLTTDLATVKSKLSATNSAAAILSAKVTTAQSDITTLQASVTSINTQLTAGAAALTAINSALQNSTTGLVGLNAARPQFGAFTNAGAIIAGTGQVTGASGPKTNATEGAGALADFYVVDFGNDVSARFLQVTQFPTGGASSNRAAMAVDCGASAAATTLCGTVEGAADSSKNHVVVQFGAAGSGAADSSWELAALSG